MKKLTIYIFISIILFYVASRLSRSNTVHIKLQKPDVEGTVAIEELSKLVDNNFLNRDYYEVLTFSDSGPYWYANYNKQHKVLLISLDAFSGWSYYYLATTSQLDTIAKKKIPVKHLRNFLEPLPPNMIKAFPTRSLDIVSIL